MNKRGPALALALALAALRGRSTGRARTEAAAADAARPSALASAALARGWLWPLSELGRSSTPDCLLAGSCAAGRSGSAGPSGSRTGVDTAFAEANGVAVADPKRAADSEGKPRLSSPGVGCGAPSRENNQTITGTPTRPTRKSNLPRDGPRWGAFDPQRFFNWRFFKGSDIEY